MVTSAVSKVCVRGRKQEDRCRQKAGVAFSKTGQTRNSAIQRPLTSGSCRYKNSRRRAFNERTDVMAVTPGLHWYAMLKVSPQSVLLPKQETLYPETVNFVARNGNKVACYLIQSCRFWQQSRLFSNTKSPVSGYKFAVSDNSRLKRQQNCLFPDTKSPVSGTSVDRP